MMQYFWRLPCSALFVSREGRRCGACRLDPMASVNRHDFASLAREAKFVT